METLHFKSRAINHLFENAQFSAMILACIELQGSVLWSGITSWRLVVFSACVNFESTYRSHCRSNWSSVVYIFNDLVSWLDKAMLKCVADTVMPVIPSRANLKARFED